AYGVAPVIGTTGLSPEQPADLARLADRSSMGAAVVPNFSVGMVLLQQADAAAARFYDHAELVELHHNRKADAPSGTCLKTAEMMEELGKTFNASEVDEHESLAGSRGGLRSSGLRLHAIRLPGLVAHQEVQFGASGERYVLRHDTFDRAAYMPGVLHTIRRVRQLSGLVYGLEKLL
ncbi:MAG: 4-hydroxy-tetrahydrodipicolinate reductase, partial [Synechococcus sp. Tobar2m-G35]|nr:4-hydroxy-tetrahydrodipicolinate reductase [Synechococcus sp. Tobar2m-G35]